MHTLHHVVIPIIVVILFPGRVLEELLGVRNERAFISNTPHLTFKHTIKFVCIINARAQCYVKRKVSKDDGRKKLVHEEEDKDANASEKNK